MSMDKTLTKRVNLEYKGLHGFYWMLYCLATGYMTVLLLSRGFSSSAIGVIAAASSILAAAGQLIVGSLADRYPRLTWKRLLLSIGALQAAALAVLVFFKGSDAIYGVFFPAFTILMYFQMPLVNSAVFYYTSRGLDVNFGSARGTGSLTYAVISFAAGQLIVRTGEIVIIYLAAAVLAGLVLITILMPCSPETETEAGCVSAPADAEKSTASAAGGLLGFIRKYPDFMVVLAGCILVMAFHNIGHTYMIQIMEGVGGDSASMGTAFSIEAVMELPVMFGFYKLIKKISADSLMIVSAAAFTLKAVTYLSAASVTALYLAQILQMFSNAVFVLASVYYADKKMAPEDQVTGQSCMTASISIGAVLGNLLGGQILSVTGLRGMLLTGVLLAAAGSAIMAAGIRFGAKRSKKTI